MQAKPGDLILILSGDDAMKVRKRPASFALKWGNEAAHENAWVTASQW